MAQQTKYYTNSEDEKELGAPVYSAYDSGARQRQSELYEQIANRGPFQYDAKNDPLYGVMKDRYVQQGRMAMKDTMGQAAALTGGYGSSYGQAVGQQQYDASLQGLADVIPELYQAAYTRYADEGDRLQNAYALAGQEAQRDYERYRDAYGDWQNERAWQRQQEQDAYGREQDAYARQQNSYSNLYNLIMSTGYNPTDEELAAAGMTREAADSILNQYNSTNQPKGGSGGGGGGNNGGNNGKGNTDYWAVITDLRNRGATDAEIRAYLISKGQNLGDYTKFFQSSSPGRDASGGGNAQTPRGRQSQALH